MFARLKISDAFFDLKRIVRNIIFENYNDGRNVCCEIDVGRNPRKRFTKLLKTRANHSYIKLISVSDKRKILCLSLRPTFLRLDRNAKQKNERKKQKKTPHGL
jgi:hypothetical protein